MSIDWHPEISDRKGPRYVVIADAISDALANGQLSGGMQLPTQRELARRLNVTIGTVSRAYQEAEKRGLVSGEVGRGTYIRETAASSSTPATDIAPEEKAGVIASSDSGPTGAARESTAESGRASSVSPRSDHGQSSVPKSEVNDRSDSEQKAENTVASSDRSVGRSESAVVHLFKKFDLPAPASDVPAPDAPPSSERSDSSNGGDAADKKAAPAPPLDVEPENAKDPSRPVSLLLRSVDGFAGRQSADLPGDETGKPINLASVRLPEASEARISAAASDVLAEVDFPRLAAMSFSPTSSELCLVAGRVLEQFGVSAGASDVVVAPTGSLALEAALTVMTNPGDGILVDGLLDPNLRAVLSRRGLRLCPVQVDSMGLVPESFELACWSSNAKLMLATPTAQNPTAATLPPERRQAILDISERYGVTLIEWVCSLPVLGRSHSPFAALAPHRTVNITDLAASCLSGLRLGLITAPAEVLEKCGREVTQQHRFIPGLLAGLLEAVSHRDTFAALTQLQRDVLSKRENALTRALGADLAERTRTSPGFGWLMLPKGWRSSDLAVAAAIRGVLVASAEHFQVGQGVTPRSVRIAWGGLSSVEEAANAGTILNQVLSSPSDSGVPAV